MSAGDASAHGGGSTRCTVLLQRVEVPNKEGWEMTEDQDRERPVEITTMTVYLPVCVCAALDRDGQWQVTGAYVDSDGAPWLYTDSEPNVWLTEAGESGGWVHDTDEVDTDEYTDYGPGITAVDTVLTAALESIRVAWELAHPEHGTLAE